LQFSNSIAYSDNSSDLPLLTWAKTGVVVSKNKSQNWAKENNLSEIVHD
jgi:phosphoserine phosphatase